jgi:E2 domain of amyloid precursor protein
LRALTGYIKVLQKDRLHTVNRYRHLRQTQVVEADASRPQMVEHLLGIDRQMAAALGMLDRLPTKYANKIKKQIGM